MSKLFIPPTWDAVQRSVLGVAAISIVDFFKAAGEAVPAQCPDGVLAVLTNTDGLVATGVTLVATEADTSQAITTAAVGKAATNLARAAAEQAYIAHAAENPEPVDPRPDWQQRVIAERDELAERNQKLAVFLDDPTKTAALEELDLALLKEQEYAQRRLINLLNARINRFKP